MIGRRYFMKGLPPRRWGKRYFLFGLAGLIVLFAGGLVPIVQRSISATETSIFFRLNRIMDVNPVWDGAIMVTASELWIYFSYAAVLLLLLAHGWRIRRVDYGQVFGFIALAALITWTTEELADLVADNLHRVLPWKDGVVEHIKREGGYDFFDVDRAEGIVDDAATALFCLFLVVRVRFPRLALAALGLLALYMFSNIVAGTQWVSVQVSSMLLGSTMAGLALMYCEGPLHYLEKKSSHLFIRLLGRLLLSRKLMERPIAVRENAGFWQQILEKSRELAPAARNRFWHDHVRPQATRLLGLDPDRCELFKNPEFTQERVKSSGRVRFLRTDEGEVFVLRATRHLGGVIRKSPNFVRFTDSLKNNLFLQRLGFPVPRIHWMQEGLTAWGLKNTVFAIEEYVPSRPLDQADPAELARAMALLARLHAHTGEGWGRVFEDVKRSRTQYVLQYLRDDVFCHLKRAGDIGRFTLNHEELNRAWGMIESVAVTTFQNTQLPFRLIHGDVSPRNFRVTTGGQLVMIDFPTVHYDLPGWEIIKASVSLTRARPEHCAAAWQAYFAAAGPERWQEFLAHGRLAFVRFALRELAHRRVTIPLAPGAKKIGKRRVLRWVEEMLAAESAPWGSQPDQTDWPAIFRTLGIHSHLAQNPPVEPVR